MTTNHRADRSKHPDGFAAGARCDGGTSIAAAVVAPLPQLLPLSLPLTWVQACSDPRAGAPARGSLEGAWLCALSDDEECGVDKLRESRTSPPRSHGLARGWGMRGGRGVRRSQSSTA